MIKKITAGGFKRFGWVIEYPAKSSQSKSKNLFRIVLRDSKSPGWRVAYLVVRDKAIARLEQHLGTYETFEPVRGRSLLYLAAYRNGPIACFLLDRPVILKKGAWHGIVTLTDETEIKITENARVKSRYWRLPHLLDHRPRRA
jgi:hypothetical protein